MIILCIYIVGIAKNIPKSYKKRTKLPTFGKLYNHPYVAASLQLLKPKLLSSKLGRNITAVVGATFG